MHYTLEMQFFWFLVGSSVLMVAAYLLVISYMRRKNGVQPGYFGLVIAAVSMACFLALVYILQRFGVDLRRGQPRELLWFTLGAVWLVLSVMLVCQRRASGAVLMDFGPNPMFKLQMAFGVFMSIMAIALTSNGESRAQAFAYAMWGGWFFAMACGRLQIRDRGIFTGAFLPWRRIGGCAATADGKVRLFLNKGLKRTLDLRLPAESRDAFIDLVRQRLDHKLLA